MFFFKWILILLVLWFLWWALTKRFIPYIQGPGSVTGSNDKYKTLLSEIDHVKTKAGTIEKEATVEKKEAEKTAKKAGEIATNAGETAEKLKKL